MGKIIGKRDCSAYWSDGWTHTDVDANAVLDEMSVLDEGFTPDDLVSLASDPSKQLHRCFTWDDTKAATQWRRQEARVLCCHLKVQYIESDKPKDAEPQRLEIRHYVKPEGKAGNYESISKVYTNIDKRELYINQFRDEIKALTRRFDMVRADFPELFDEIDAL